MKQRILWIALITGALALALSVSTAFGAITDIFGTAHDLGSPGSPTCMQCHTPHDAEGDFLWAQTPSTRLTGQGALCFSCHDGAIAGQWIPDYASHPVTPGVDGQDCDRCHDPHEDNWKFASDILAPNFQNANLCRNCHFPGTISHAVDVETTLPVDRVWSPPSDFEGTRLFNSAGSDTVPTGAGYVKCATCHSPHGGSGTGMNTMPASDPGNSSAPLCQNCHQ
jgi:predicted CXXCH cytochrome family protein